MPIDYSKFDGIDTDESEDERKREHEARHRAGDFNSMMDGLRKRDSGKATCMDGPQKARDKEWLRAATRTPSGMKAYGFMLQAREFAASGDKEQAFGAAAVSFLFESSATFLDPRTADGRWQPFEKFLEDACTERIEFLCSASTEILSKYNNRDFSTVPIGRRWFRHLESTSGKVCYSNSPIIGDQTRIKDVVTERPANGSCVLNEPNTQEDRGLIIDHYAFVVLAHLQLTIANNRDAFLRVSFNMVMAVRLRPWVHDLRGALAKTYALADSHLLAQDELMCALACPIEEDRADIAKRHVLWSVGMILVANGRPKTYSNLGASMLHGSIAVGLDGNREDYIEDGDPELGQIMEAFDALSTLRIRGESNGEDLVHEDDTPVEPLSLTDIRSRADALYPRLAAEDRSRLGNLKLVRLIEAEAAAATPPPPPRPPKEERKRLRRICDVCGKQGSIEELCFPVCDVCSNRRYCGLECQRADWNNGHREQCTGPD